MRARFAISAIGMLLAGTVMSQAALGQTIDLGPDGGSGGGRIVAEGFPADVAAQALGHTARALGPSAGTR